MYFFILPEGSGKSIRFNSVLEFASDLKYILNVLKLQEIVSQSKHFSLALSMY